MLELSRFNSSAQASKERDKLEMHFLKTRRDCTQDAAQCLCAVPPSEHQARVPLLALALPPRETGMLLR